MQVKMPRLELSFPDSPMRGFIKMEGFLKYFPDADIPEEIDRSERSSVLRLVDVASSKTHKGTAI